MSATWNRAQELGQPLTLMLIGVSKPGSRRSSSACRSAARCLVSTIASLQNSIPVQAIVPRRNADGATSRSRVASSSASSVTRSSGTSRMSSFCWAVVRTRPDPYASARSATCQSRVPEVRPTLGATPR